MSLAGQPSRFAPQFPGDRQRIDAKPFPPKRLAAGTMDLVVVDRAKRHREFITHLEREASRLCEGQMMGMGWNVLADKTGKRCHVMQMGLVPQPSYRSDRQRRLVDARSLRNAGWCQRMERNIRGRSNRSGRCRGLGSVSPPTKEPFKHIAIVFAASFQLRATSRSRAT